MGGLHIEQVMLKMHAQLVVGTGIEEILSVTQLSQAGAGTLIASASQNCPTRYVVEVCYSINTKIWHCYLISIKLLAIS